jgi:hypothetical protein
MFPRHKIPKYLTRGFVSDLQRNYSNHGKMIIMPKITKNMSSMVTMVCTAMANKLKKCKNFNEVNNGIQYDNMQL